MKLKRAILALKDPAVHPSQLISRPDVVADIASDISMGMLAPGSTLVSRYDDFVWVHHQVMMQGPNDPEGPNMAHRGPAFGPWHRALLKLYEQELQSAAGDPGLTLPYWDWTKDQGAADPGFPFTTDFLGGDGAGNPNDKVATGAFSQAAGWTLKCDEEGFFFLRRHFGGDGPGLPTPASVKAALNIAPYDSSPWNINSASPSSFRNTLEGWVGPRQIHNAVHRWVDGSMQPGTSPNDPVFFLHHCNIDRLWAVWEQKQAGASSYLPDNTTPAASGLTRLNENMATFGHTPTDRYFSVDISPAGVVNSKAITWYDSDLPELNNETGGSLAFVNIPAGLTTYKAVKFRIKGCRPVHFRITAAPGGQFGLTNMGSEFTAEPDDSASFYYGYVWVQLTAVAGPVAPSSVDIHAYIIDQEGYYAATEGGEYPLGDFHVTLTATTVARENNSVALVLDRSGSMADPAGGTSTKSTLLKQAISVFNSLMLTNDEIALVSFDDLIATPAHMQAVSAGAVAPIVAGTDLDPRGLTCIGGGILEGAVELGLGTHSNKSMIVLTDGNENVHPYVAQLPAGTISARTYAIGFGMPADVSAAVLQEITSNTHGDLIITGNMSAAEQGFDLTKYFVQMLAGVSNMSVLLDPQGSLFLGSEHVIPFDVTEADVYVDVIALCPAPQILDFRLQAPSGTIIGPAGGDPNVRYTIRPEVAFYRIVLPALAGDPAGTHGGTWNAILALKDRKKIDDSLKDDDAARLRNRLVRGSLPYSLVVHAYSNIQFDARLRQGSLDPGATVVVEALLKRYDVPFPDDATVWAEITAPDVSSVGLDLARIAPGVFAGSFTASLPGVYRVRVRAEGYFESQDRFTREKTLTAATYLGDQSATRPNDYALCELLRCLTSGAVLTSPATEKLHELGVDAEALKKCLEEHCRTPRESSPPAPREEQQPVPAAPAEGGLPIESLPAAIPVERPEVEPTRPRLPAASRTPRVIHMFTRPEETEAAVNPAAEATPQASPEAFPRIVRMFTHPEEIAVEEQEADDEE
ncbi:MAG: tyrosinase family protein [Actinomycetota bacterium]|nr:tyrosinase family protein [Actinomycetota bacterium]